MLVEKEKLRAATRLIAILFRSLNRARNIDFMLNKNEPCLKKPINTILFQLQI